MKGRIFVQFVILDP